MNNSNFKKTLIFIILAAMLIAIPISCNRATNTTSESHVSSPIASKTPQKSENPEATPTPSLTTSPTPTVSRAQVEYYSDGFGGSVQRQVLFQLFGGFLELYIPGSV